MKYNLLISLFLVGAATIAHAELHKWVDENGVVVYSQTAPPSVESQTIKPPPPPATDTETARTELQGQIDRLDSAREARTTAGAEQAAADLQKAEDAAACDDARKYLAKLENAQRVNLTEADGSARRLDETELNAMREEARNQVKELCGGN